MTAPYYYVYPFAVQGSNTSPVPTQYQNNNQISYQDGWTPAYELDLSVPDSGAIPVSRTQTNQLFFDVTNNIQQYQQQGVPYWYANNGLPSPDTASILYPLYSRVVYTDGNVYESQITNNTNTPGTDGTWLNISSATVVPGTVIMFAGSSVLAGYLNCLGQSLTTTDYPALFRNIGYTWGGSGTTFYLPVGQNSVNAGAGGTLFGSPDTVGLSGGSATTNQIVSHTHVATVNGDNNAGTGDGTSVYTTNRTGTAHTSTVINAAPAGAVSAQTIVQPTNIMLMLIKY